MPEGKVAIVTGGGSGIGRAAALTLQADGYNVTIAGRRAPELLETSNMATADGGDMLPVPTDVTDETAVADLFAETVNKFGRLDVLFNNAGMALPGTPIEDLEVEKWRAIVDVNLTGCFLCAQAAIRVMKVQDPKGGRIINNGSISAHVPRPGSAPYTSTKHAITGLTRSLALDGRVNDIACGQIDIGNALTELSAAFTEGVPQADGSIKPEAMMDVEHVADAVLYMANLPLDANVLFMTVMATKMPFVGRG
jgi:NAD(P)-dependent dehydrogenase (short-subunit alcohol dehydrogenase family)